MWKFFENSHQRKNQTICESRKLIGKNFRQKRLSRRKIWEFSGTSFRNFLLTFLGIFISLHALFYKIKKKNFDWNFPEIFFLPLVATNVSKTECIAATMWLKWFVWKFCCCVELKSWFITSFGWWEAESEVLTADASGVEVELFGREVVVVCFDVDDEWSDNSNAKHWAEELEKRKPFFALTWSSSNVRPRMS